ncbi:MAG: sigma-70 family RNA polymerase sigma factor [Myxococcota bacterium]
MFLALDNIEAVAGGAKERSAEEGGATELIERCRSGEAAAYETLYRLYFPTVYRWIFRLGGAEADVEDICHDVFLVVFRNIRHFRGDSRFSSWLYGITKKTVSYHFRKKRMLEFFGFGEKMNDEEIPSSHKSPLQSAEERDATTKLYALLEKLPPNQREVFILFELEEMSGEEISSLLKVNINTVFARLFHARKKLRAMASRRFKSEL